MNNLVKFLEQFLGIPIKVINASKEKEVNLRGYSIKFKKVFEEKSIDDFVYYSLRPIHLTNKDVYSMIYSVCCEVDLNKNIIYGKLLDYVISNVASFSEYFASVFMLEDIKLDIGIINALIHSKNQVYDNLNSLCSKENKNLRLDIDKFIKKYYNFLFLRILSLYLNIYSSINLFPTKKAELYGYKVKEVVLPNNLRYTSREFPLSPGLEPDFLIRVKDLYSNESFYIVGDFKFKSKKKQVYISSKLTINSIMQYFSAYSLVVEELSRKNCDFALLVNVNPYGEIVGYLMFIDDLTRRVSINLMKLYLETLINIKNNLLDKNILDRIEEENIRSFISMLLNKDKEIYNKFKLSFKGRKIVEWIQE